MEIFFLDNWDQNKRDKQKNFLRLSVAVSVETIPLE